jgi:hypothetical protein
MKKNKDNENIILFNVFLKEGEPAPMLQIGDEISLGRIHTGSNIRQLPPEFYNGEHKEQYKEKALGTFEIVRIYKQFQENLSLSPEREGTYEGATFNRSQLENISVFVKEKDIPKDLAAPVIGVL